MSNRRLLVALTVGVFLIVALLFNAQFQPFRTVPATPGVYVKCLMRQACYQHAAGDTCYALDAANATDAAYLALCR